jgi:hypothetical protein
MPKSQTVGRSSQHFGRIDSFAVRRSNSRGRFETRSTLDARRTAADELRPKSFVGDKIGVRVLRSSPDDRGFVDRGSAIAETDRRVPRSPIENGRRQVDNGGGRSEILGVGRGGSAKCVCIPKSDHPMQHIML